MAKFALELGLVKSVVIVPNRLNPLKSGIVSNFKSPTAEQRLEMVRIAVLNEPNIHVSDIELRRQPPSYTIDTIEEILKETGPTDVSFICGADVISKFHLWNKVHDLIAIINSFLVFTRKIALNNIYSSLSLHFTKEELDKFKEISFPYNLQEISATNIRKLILDKKDVDQLLPKEVYEYILAHDLYR